MTAGDFHVTDMLHKSMHRHGANLSELKMHLKTITDDTSLTEGVREPKARPDHYF